MNRKTPIQRRNRGIPAALALALAALPGLAAATTVSTTFDYAARDVGLSGGGALAFDRSLEFDAGVADVRFGARASSGDVDASGRATVNASFDDTVALADATSVAVSLSNGGLSFGFDTFAGATASAGIDFDAIYVDMPFPVPDIDINPSEISLGTVGYGLATSASGSSYGSAVSDRAAEEITGFGTPDIPLITPTARISLDGSQISSMIVSDLVGVVRATHEGGTVLTDAFSLLGDATSMFSLALAGVWDIELIDVALLNSFDTSLGLAASTTVGFSAGLGCGDPTTDSDNGFGCIYDTGRRATSPQLTLIDPAAFAIDWGLKSASLGSITVLAAPVTAVPVPASLPLLLAGSGLLWGLRRRRA